MYFWKKYCFKAVYNKFIENRFNRKKGQVTFYYTGFLRDAIYIILVLFTKFLAQQSGLLYSQWYIFVKEIGNTQAYYPFDWDPIIKLIFDKNIWEANNVSAKQFYIKD